MLLKRFTLVTLVNWRILISLSPRSCGGGHRRQQHLCHFLAAAGVAESLLRQLLVDDSRDSVLRALEAYLLLQRYVVAVD